MIFARHSFTRINEKFKGFTLLEMLISMAILSVILIIFFSAFHVQRKVSKSQDEMADALNNAHLALDAISRHIKLAGSGLTNGSITAAGHDIGGDVNGATDTVTVIHGDSDIVTFVGVFEEEKGELNGIASEAGSTITLENSTQAGSFNITVKKYISIGGQDSYAITSIAGNDLNISPGTTTIAYKDETPVFLIRAVTYQIIDVVDSEGNKIPTLKVNENTGSGARSFVDYIKDIQIDLLPSASDWDRGSITVVAVTRTPNKGTVTLHAIVRTRNK